MLKWLMFLVAAAWLVSSWSRRGAERGRGAGNGRTRGRTDGRGRAAQADPERMLRCAECEVFVPASQAVIRGAETFCCEAHAKAWAGKSEGARR